MKNQEHVEHNTILFALYGTWEGLGGCKILPGVGEQFADYFENCLLFEFVAFILICVYITKAYII